jgi:ribose transport system substrate-binding protein
MQRTTNGARRRLALCAAGLVAAALALGACGDDEDDAGSAASGGSTTAASGDGSKPYWCGDKEIKLGIQDGGGLNAWSAESLRQVKLEAEKCPAIKDQIVVNAGFDPQKATSGLQSLVSQGANAIAIIPDAGVCAELPAMRQATQRGVKVATWAADGCGKAGTDYQSYTDWDPVENGRTFTKWMAEQMGGKGNLLFLGGPPGNLVDQGIVKGMYEVLEQYPDITVLENVSEKSWPVTNWDPAQAQKVTAALLAKHPQIDGYIDGYGAEVLGALKAFEDAGRKIPPITTTQSNALSCLRDKQTGDDKFALSTVSNRNWIGRLAVRQAVAAVNGIAIADKQTIELPLLEDSTNPDMEPKCYPDKGPDYDPSSEISDDEVDELAAAGPG